MTQLTEKQKLVRDIEGLKNSLSLDFIDLTNPSLTSSEKEGIRTHMDWIIKQLKDLQSRLEIIDTVD
jgi:hypothetical protein